MSSTTVKLSHLKKIIDEEIDKTLSKEKVPTIKEMESTMQKWIAYENKISLNESTEGEIEESLVKLFGGTIERGYLLPRSIKAVLNSKTYKGQRFRAAYYYARNRIVPALRKLAFAARDLGGRAISATAARPILARLGLYGVAALIVYNIYKANRKGLDVFGGVGGISKGNKKFDKVDPNAKSYRAAQWDKWPLKVQCNFCKRNGGRKPYTFKGKTSTEVTIGPTCAELKTKCRGGGGGGRSLCTINNRLIKKNTDLGPNLNTGYKELKTYLKKAGQGKGLDLNSGKCTKPLISAIKAFQAANKLTSDGLYGTQTHSKMKEVLKNQLTPRQKMLKKDAETNIKRLDSLINKKQKLYDKLWQEYSDLDEAGVEPSDGIFADDNEERMFELKKSLDVLSNQLQTFRVSRDNYKTGLDPKKKTEDK